jgi:hypothetical protein
LIFFIANQVRVENVQLPEYHIQTVLERAKTEYLEKIYKIEKWEDANDFLEKIAYRTGRLLKVGEMVACLGDALCTLLLGWGSGCEHSRQAGLERLAKREDSILCEATGREA